MTHIGQDGMVDDWWHAPGKIAAPPTLRWKLGGGGYLSGIYGIGHLVSSLNKLLAKRTGIMFEVNMSLAFLVTKYNLDKYSSVFTKYLGKRAPAKDIREFCIYFYFLIFKE